MDYNEIDKLLNNEGLSKKLIRILNSIKKYSEKYEKWSEYVKRNDDEETDDYYPESELTFIGLNNEDVKKLMQLGFGVEIYDDSNEFSDDFNDKYTISWEWTPIDTW